MNCRARERRDVGQHRSWVIVRFATVDVLDAGVVEVANARRRHRSRAIP